MMDINECIGTRRSVRRYRTKRVEWDKIGSILDAGRYAPSAGNLQSWRFVVVEDEKRRQDVAEACNEQHWMNQAPVHVVVCADSTKSEQFYGDRGKEVYSVQECSAAMQLMLLEATKLGLGSCWVGSFNEDMLKRACRIPDNVKPQAVLVFGYAAEHEPMPERYTIQDTVFFEEYGKHLQHPEVAHMDFSMHMERKAKEHAKRFKKKAESVMEKIREKTKHFGQ